MLVTTRLSCQSPIISVGHHYIPGFRRTTATGPAGAEDPTPQHFVREKTLHAPLGDEILQHCNHRLFNAGLKSRDRGPLPLSNVERPADGSAVGPILGMHPNLVAKNFLPKKSGGLP